MLLGPVFHREALTLPRQFKHFLVRSGYLAALFVLMYTAGQTVFGWQQVRNLGEMAQFGNLIFQVFSIVQLTLVLFFALLFSAGSIAQEKDRRTLILMLMTDLHDRELVLGKLSASLFQVIVLLAASCPVFMLLTLLGGVTFSQIGWAIAICTSAALAAGSWGSLVGFAREKTFQTLAISVMGLVLYVGLLEAVHAFAPDGSAAAAWSVNLNPYRALAGVIAPFSAQPDATLPIVNAWVPVASLLVLTLALDVTAVWGLRRWNPPRVIHQQQEETSETVKVTKHRRIWDNPVIWREICTRAYGRKVVLIKVAFLVLSAFIAAMVYGTPDDGSLVLGMIPTTGFALVGVLILSLMLINAQAVTSITSERDGQTLELLLVTDVSAKEFVFGKLGGVLYNSKELVLVPLIMIGYHLSIGIIDWENALYLTLGFLMLCLFSSMLGLHSGFSYDNSRSGIANSLGTMFFLFVGIFIFMMLLVEARSSFMLQFQSFLVFIGAGSIGLGVSLMHKNPSNALMISAGTLPFLTFWAITEFLLGGSLGVFLAIVAAYGFTTLAMLIPAVSEFDVALGRTTLDKG